MAVPLSNITNTSVRPTTVTPGGNVMPSPSAAAKPAPRLELLSATLPFHQWEPTPHVRLPFPVVAYFVMQAPVLLPDLWLLKRGLNE